ncbi:MAG: GNAT family N-acetyltransferase [Pseudoruegeria sp.]
MYIDALRHSPPAKTEAFLTTEAKNLLEIYLPNTTTMVIGKIGKPEGFISLLQSEIAGLFVHPNFHRLGIGTTLLNWAKAEHSELCVEVFTSNTPARAFYTRQGFQRRAKRLHPETGFDLEELEWTQAPQD